MKSWTFWLLLGQNAVGSGVAAAAGVLLSNAAKTLGSVPWYGVVSTGVITALAVAMLSLASELKKGTLPATLVPATPEAMALVSDAVAERLVARRAHGKGDDR
jgi:hypothetical protein